MNCFIFPDWIPFWDWFAQTLTADDVLQQQMELLNTLREENRSLSESFTTYVNAMQFVLIIFAFLGGVIAYVFGKNLQDARQIAREIIDQEVNRRIVTIVDAEINNVTRCATKVLQKKSHPTKLEVQPI